MTRPVSYTPAQRAEVLAAMATGESVRQTAARLGIPAGTIGKWRAELKQGPVAEVVAEMLTLQPVRAATEDKQDLGALVGEYLGAGLRTLRTQAEFAADRTWLEKQNAADLAVFHGVLADKLIRVLSALRPADDGDGAGTELSDGDAS